MLLLSGLPKLTRRGSLPAIAISVVVVFVMGQARFYRYLSTLPSPSSIAGIAYGRAMSIDGEGVESGLKPVPSPVTEEVMPPSLLDVYAPRNLQFNVTRSMLRQSRPVGDVRSVEKGRSHGVRALACECMSRCRSADCCADVEDYERNLPSCARPEALTDVTMACPESFSSSLPPRADMPTLFLIGPGHTGSSELWRQVLSHPSAMHPEVPKGQPKWRAKEPDTWRMQWDNGRGPHTLATKHAPGTVLVDGTPMSGSIEAPIRMSAIYSCYGPDGVDPLAGLHFVMMMRDPISTVMSSLKHSVGSKSGDYKRLAAHSFQNVSSYGLVHAKDGGALEDALLTCVTEYEDCAAPLRAGHDASLAWPTCAARIQGAGCGGLRDCVICRAVANTFVSDIYHWWRRFVGAGQIQIVRNSHLTGGDAARAVWRMVGLDDPAESNGVSDAHVSSNSHASDNTPGAIRQLEGSTALKDAFAAELSRQSYLLDGIEGMIDGAVGNDDDGTMEGDERGESITTTNAVRPVRNGNKDNEGTQGETNPPRNITVGLVANEFFDPSIGRTGGFGMATNMVGKFFRSRPDLGISIVFVFASPEMGTDEFGKVIHHELLGWPLIGMSTDPGARTRKRATAAVKGEHIDVFLTIDYRKDYDKVFSILPDVPIILWARDPRTRAQIANLEGIRHPDFPDKVLSGLKAPLATKARSVWMKKEGLDDGPDFVLKDPRRFLIGVVWMPALYERLQEAYDISPEEIAMPLPNIVEGCGPEYIQKSEMPVVIFVGRLDPYKRPWLLIELAYSFPGVEFWVLGRGHFPKSYDIEKDDRRPVPSNVKLLGQEIGDAKWERLGKAWFLLSTSAHEGLAISYLEALTCETPVLSTVDPGGFVSRFGVFAGEFKGSGMDGLPSLREGFDKLLSNHTFREEKGRLGREHVASTHNEKTIL